MSDGPGDGGPRLDCLGSASAFSHGRYWSGFLLDGRVLLDCPPQTLAHLYRLEVSVEQIDLVLLSHQHTDHILGLDLFLLDAMLSETEQRGNPFAIAGPPGIYDRAREVVGDSSRLPPRDPSAAERRITWFEQSGGSAFEWAGAKVECVEVEHAPDITALGFRVHLGGRLLAYSGDTRMCDALLTLADGADALIVECGGRRESHHMEWEDVFALREALPASTRMLVTHYDHRTAPDVSAVAGLTLAEDFARYEV